MGIAFDKALMSLYSIGEDGKFVISSKQRVIEISPEMKQPLKYMLFHPERAIFMLGDSDGHIYIYT